MRTQWKKFVTRDRLIACSLFVFMLAVFLLSQVRQVADSEYSMLLSESLLHHRSFTLDQYAIPRLQPKQQVGYVSNGPLYQIELVNGHPYYFFPPGSSILSAPYVAVMNAFGISAVNSDGTYNHAGENVLELILSALLMSGLAVVIFCTSRWLLPPGWSFLIAFGSALGTQIWSTASRALWSDTWGIFLLGLVLYFLVGASVGKTRVGPFLLATLCAWLYFVRPTYSVAILAVTVYILAFHRPAFTRFALAGVIWFAGFVVYSEVHFGKLLPNYYQANRLSFGTFWMALAGNLISPSRGLLIFVPILFFIGYLLVRYRQALLQPQMVLMSLAVIVVHIVIVSGFVPWYGGYSYGPRYSTGVVPWFALLGIFAVNARLRWRESAASRETIWRWRTEWAAGAVLLLCSMTINGRGAMAHSTWLWNMRPINVDEKPERVWDWKHPQFLASLNQPAETA